MPCQNCKKKKCGITMTCKYCSGDFCISCLHLEKHKCPGIEDKIKMDREILSKKIPGSVKMSSICVKRLNKLNPQQATSIVPHIKFIFLATLRILSPQIISSGPTPLFSSALIFVF